MPSQKQIFGRNRPCLSIKTAVDHSVYGRKYEACINPNISAFVFQWVNLFQSVVKVLNTIHLPSDVLMFTQAPLCHLSWAS